MDSNHINVRRVVEEDRLSSLPDDLIHKILSCFDMKYAVQTCLLSSRWEILWKSMPCLNISSHQFHTLRKFGKFVNHVLNHRNHQTEVSSVKLYFHGAANQVFVKKIANYAFSLIVQELAVVRSDSSRLCHAYPPCLFRSQSLKHFTFGCYYFHDPISITPETPWDFPALTNLHLSRIILRGDLFSKCVNLTNLTLKKFNVAGLEEVLHIITPRLSNLILIDGVSSKTINLIAPQLENLTVTNCSFGYLNAPPALSSFCYTSQFGFGGLPRFSNDRFHSLNKVTIQVSYCYSYKVKACEEKDACRIISMLQQLHTAKYLTLASEVVECISPFPDLLSQHSSPFRNLICLTIIDFSKRNDAHKVTMSSEARNFLLDNPPSATLIMK